MSLTHQLVQERIQSGQRLTSEEQTALNRHLASCPECRAFAEFHQQLGEMLPAVYTLKRRSEREMRAQIEAAKDRLAKRRWQALILRGSLSLAGAGAVLLLLVIFIYLPRMMPDPSPAAPVSTSVSISISMPEEPEPSLQQPEPTATATASFAQAVTTARTATPTPELLATNAPVVEPAGFVKGVAMIGQTAFTGTGARVAAVDISQPANPKVLALSPELPGSIGKILPVNSGKAPRIVAVAGRYLVVLENAVPGDLGLVTQSKLPGPIQAMIHDISASRLYSGGTLNGDPSKGFVTIHDTTADDQLQLLYTLLLDAPVRSLALSKDHLYAATGGSAPGVLAAAVINDRLGEPVEAIPALSVSSMTATGGVLYIGASRQMLAYDLNDPGHPQLAWQANSAGEAAIPGAILGFALRADAIHLSGMDADGAPFRLVLTPPEPVTAATVVDTASMISVARGLMLVAGERIEIYDIHDLENVMLLANMKIQP